MGITVYQIKDIKMMLDELGRSCNIISLGYPTMLFGKNIVEQMFGGDIAKNVDVDDKGNVESYSLFEALGHQLVSIDFISRTGTEIFVDLNHPIPDSLNEKFDIVIDPGTIEHCFNVAQAVENVARMTAIGGFAYHVNPMVMINHGYYNFSPRFYTEFYSNNGFDVRKVHALNFDLRNGFTRIPEIDKIKRSRLKTNIVPESVVVSLSQKTQTMDEVKYPAFTEEKR